ncbi:MAG: GNAT family N-acetyltransferase [Ruminococcus sp.]|nr:GNAT family N-acetyltransferase [Ruminococcus sp.]
MNYSIREMKKDEIKALDTFLYEAIYIPKGVSAPSKDIIKQPELQVYIKDFGENKGDLCLVAEVNNEIVGAVWVRIMNDYGHIDDETPSFAISLLKQYRNYGIGTELMQQMLIKLKMKGYKRASLAVQKMNYAVRMYQKVGFEIVSENNEEYIMIYRL